LTPSIPEDEKLVEIANELCRELRIKFQPKAVSWWDSKLVHAMGYIFTLMHMSDYCFFNHDTVMIAKALRGKLEPEEWKTLMAASLTLRKKTRTKQLPVYMSTTILLPVFLITLIGFVFVKYVPISIISISLLLILVFAATLFPMWRFQRYYKKLWLIADEQAAELVGREALLHTLRKIDGLGLRDLEWLKGGVFGDRRWTRPSVPERIENLLASTQAA